MKTKFNGILTLLLAFVVQISFAQTTVTGTVTEENGPLPGANVIIKGTTTGTQTDFDGNYSIQANSNDVLVFSFVGFTTKEVLVGNQNTINTMLELDNALDEVIVTGVAGATSKKKLAISAASVSSELLEKVPATSAAGALQGKVAGVTVVQPSGLPGSSAVINIRGVTSLLGNQNPLIIVDGVLLGSANLADFNSEDIKSIEVLKGAAAASLYGSRAANGVVQIITKRGSQNMAPQVTLRAETGISTILNKYDEADSHNYLLNPDGSFQLDGTGALILDYDTTNQVPNESIIDNPFPATYNNFDKAFGSGVYQTFSAAVAGGFDGGRYYTSFQDNQNTGIINIGDLGYKRQTGKVNLDYDISDKFKFTTSNSYSQVNSREPALGSGGPLYTLQFTPPHFNLSAPNEEDGSPYNWNPFADNADGIWPTQETNPFYYLDNYKYAERRERFTTNAGLKYMPLDWLTLEGVFSLDNLNFRSNTFVDKDWLDDQNSTFINGNINQFTSNYQNEAIQFNTYTDNQFGKLEVKSRLQYLQENENFTSQSVNGTSLQVLGINSLENILQTDLSVNSNRTKTVSKSYSGILNFVYDEKFIIDGLARFEQVSTYGPNARDQWFYRASAAYRISEDLDIDGIDEFKIRGSYGTSGLRPPYFAQYETVTLANGLLTPNLVGNANLGASVSTEKEVGIDLDFLSRFRTSFNYSNTDNEGLVIPVPVAAATGFSEQYQNAASINSQVFEASLGVDILRSENINWNFNALFSKYESEITSFGRADLQVGPSSAFILREGEIYGTFYGKQFMTSLDQLPDTVDPSDYTLYNGIVVLNDGTNSPQKIREEDGTEAIVEIGNTTPDFNMSFNTNFSYRNWNLYALVDWQQGGDVYNQTKQWRYRELLSSELTGETVGWASGLYSINEVNDYFVEDGTFVKLRELSLSYEINPRFLENTFLSRATLGVVGRNLFIITDYSGVDPEVSNIDGGSDGRFNDLSAYKFDAFGYPSTRTFSGVVTLTF